MEIEIWKEVKGSNGKYDVSNLGRVRSYRNSRVNIIKGSRSRKGYLVVTVLIDSVFRKIKVHQCVAESFLNHVRCGMEITVDHIDGNKLNNHVSNLQLLSNRDNVKKYIKEKFSHLPDKCSVDECDKKHHGKTFCSYHYKKMWLSKTKKCF